MVRPDLAHTGPASPDALGCVEGLARQSFNNSRSHDSHWLKTCTSERAHLRVARHLGRNTRLCASQSGRSFYSPTCSEVDHLAHSLLLSSSVTRNSDIGRNEIECRTKSLTEKSCQMSS